MLHSRGMTRAKWGDLRLKLPGQIEPRLLGRGATSKVYEGDWLQTPVAVKIIHSVVDSTVLVRDLEIIRSWGRHECVAHTYALADDLPRHEGDIAILTEYARFGDLQQYLDAASAPGQPGLLLSQILRIAVDVADGMRFCHAHGLAHRDLKSQNVLIFDGGRAKVTDLVRPKVAKIGDGDSPIDQFASNHGSVQYSAPECLGGDDAGAGNILASADVYSFGVILWELVTRQRPWGTKSATQIIIAVYRGESLPIPPISQGCPAAVQAVMVACLSKDPLHRPRFEAVYNELFMALHEAASQSFSGGFLLGGPSGMLPDGSAPHMFGVSGGNGAGVGGGNSGNSGALSINTFPRCFYCPLSRQLLIDPVVLADGNSYERSLAEQWLQLHDTSPLTHDVLPSKLMFPNSNLKQSIFEWSARLQQQQQQQSAFVPGPAPGLRAQSPLELHHHSLAHPPPPGYGAPNQAQAGGSFLSLTGLTQPPGTLPLHQQPYQNQLMFGQPDHNGAAGGVGVGVGAGAVAGAGAGAGGLASGLSLLGDGLNAKWGGASDFDMPPSAASSLLMNLSHLDAGSVGGSGGVGGVVGVIGTNSDANSTVAAAATATSGGGVWNSLGGSSLLFPAGTTAQAPPAQNQGPGSLQSGATTRSSATLSSPYSPTSTKSDELEEAAPPAAPRDRGNGAPMRLFPNVAAAAAALSPAEAGKAIKSLFAKGSGGDASNYCDVRTLRRSLVAWSDQPDVLNWPDPLDNGMTALHEAARLGQREAVKLLLATPGVQPNTQDNSGASPLRLAVAAGLTPIVRVLLEHPSVDVNQLANDGTTALSQCKDLPKFAEIKRILRRAGALLPGESASSWLPPARAPESARAKLMDCVARRDVAGLVELAQQWEAAPELFNEGDPRDRGNTPLLIAASDRGGASVVALFLTLPFIEINKPNVAGEIALHLCCRHNNMDSLRRILATQEADVNHQDASQGRTPIMAAIKAGHKDIVKLLCAQPEIDLAVVDKKGLNALALSSRQPEIKEFLTREMAKAAAAASAAFAVQVTSPPAGAAPAEIADVVSALRSRDVRLVGQCLVYAAKGGDLEAVERINVEWQGSGEVWNFSDPSNNGYSPLHFAVLHDHPRIVKALCGIQHVNVNHVDSENMTPAHVAVLEDRRECLKVLLAADHIDLRRRDRNTDTPLSMCGRHDRRNCAKLILGHHSARRFINGTNPGGLTTLNIACFNGFIEIVKLLLTNPDVDVNKPNKKNSTPLIEAVRKGKVDIVKLLVKHPRIDLEHRCNFGGDALASSSRFPDIKAVLLEEYRIRGITPVTDPEPAP